MSKSKAKASSCHGGAMVIPDSGQQSESGTITRQWSRLRKRDCYGHSLSYGVRVIYLTSTFIIP